MVGIISVVIGSHFGGGDHFDGGDHFGGGTVQQEYNSLLVNALNCIFKSSLSLNNYKWLLTKLEISCIRNITPRSRKASEMDTPF